MSYIGKRFECVALDGGEFILRPEQIFAYFLYVDYIWREEIIRAYARRLLGTECTHYFFVGSRAELWVRIFSEEEDIREEDGFYREPRLFRALTSFENLLFEMQYRYLQCHPKDIAYLFYDREELKEKTMGGFIAKITCFHRTVEAAMTRQIFDKS